MTTTTVQHRSYSQVRQVRQCGEAYRLERVERVPSRPSCAAVAGKVVHTASETVDHMLHDDRQTDREVLVNEAETAGFTALYKEVEQSTTHYPVERWKRFGREDLTWWETVGIPQAIRAYVDWRLSTPDLVLADIPGFGPAIEVPFTVSIGGVLVRGYIDRVFQNRDSGELLLMDIKSGAKPKTDEQLGVYRHALSLIGMQVTWGLYVYGLKHGAAKLTSPLDLRHWTVEKLSSLYVQADELISRGLFVPNPGESCFFCSVSEHCSFYQSTI